MVEKSQIKYFTKEQCEKLNDLFRDWKIGFTGFLVHPDLEKYKNGVCLIGFGNIGNFELEIYDSNLNAIEIDNSKVNDAEFNSLVVDNKVSLNNSNIKKLNIYGTDFGSFTIEGADPIFKGRINGLYIKNNEIDKLKMNHNEVRDLELLDTDVDVAVKDTVSKINFEKYEPK